MTRNGTTSPTAARLLLDPLRCDGVGMCAFLAPDVVGTDRWGYPVVGREPVRGRALRQANAAARACPRRALTVVPTDT